MQQLRVMAIRVLRQQWTCIRHTPEHMIVPIRILFTFRQIVTPRKVARCCTAAQVSFKVSFRKCSFLTQSCSTNGQGQRKKNNFYRHQKYNKYICTIIIFLLII
jgi:hypothetical protein